jgi:uncharacterized iron-regulated protein
LFGHHRWKRKQRHIYGRPKENGIALVNTGFIQFSMGLQMHTTKYLAIIAILFLLSGCSITKALRVEDRTMVDVSTMIGGVSDVPVVLIGERHDSMEHHKLQLEVLKGLKAKGKLIAIGMEMFEETSQRAVHDWVAGDLSREDFLRLYQRNWRNVPYRLYEDIFDYARENHIQIIALNAPRYIVEKVSQHGFSSLTEDDKHNLPPGADAEVSDTYLEFIRLSYGAHSQNSEHFRHICEAQVLRNWVMASRIRWFHQLEPSKVVVVLAGGAHVRGNGGIPDELGDLPFKIILPPFPGFSDKSITSKDTNYLLEEPFSIFNYL